MSASANQTLFLTGATGVLGSHLLKRLLAETRHEVHCLVRAATPEEGAHRLHSFLKVYDPDDTLGQAFKERVKPVLGDVTLDHFGLDPSAYQRLVERVDSTIHAAASTNLFLSYRRIEPINVGGTRRMIEFVLQTRSRYLCYISTYTVLGDRVFDPTFRFDETMLDVGQRFENMAYQNSKFIAENMLREAQTRGLIWNVMRPGQVFGESTTGHYPNGQTNVSGLFLDIFKTVMETGVAFRSTTHFDVCPVDFVSEAILYLGMERQDVLNNAYQTYHLLNPQIRTYSDVVGLIRSLGYDIRNVDQQEYKRMLFESGLLVGGVEYKSATTKGFRWWFNREVFDFSQSAITDCTRTTRLLEAAGITCPPLDARLIQTYVDAGIREGYFTAPGAAPRVERVHPRKVPAPAAVAFGVQTV